MVIRVPDQRNTPGGYTALDDRMLVLDFQAGNPQAFVEIHRRYGALARHVCQRFLPTQPDVDEAFQETMIRVFQGLYRFNGRYALQPWIARIAKNVSLDILRGHARRPRTADSAPASDELPMPGDEADEIVERLVQRDTVLAVLADLPETHRRALMMRELEGRSHREVAQEMEITTGQAKALIHRAKGSFRRRWLEKVSDRGGFMAIAFLPLLWAAKFGHGLRRVVDKVGFAAQGAQAAAPEAVTSVSSTVTATAAPAATGVAERVVAAGMTILLAGGVTVGAAKIVRSNHQADPRDAGAAVAVVALPTTAPAVNKHDVAHLREHDADARRIQPGKIAAEPPIVAASGEDPQPATEQPPTDPSPGPDPSPSPSPEPTPPPAPAFSFEATSSTTSVETCDCPGDGKLAVSQVNASDDGISFSQTIRGGVLDAAGDPTWPFSLLQWGEVGGGQGHIEFRLTLSSAGGDYLYAGNGTLAEATQTDAGGSIYRFEGTFQLLNGSQAVAGVPVRGFASATLGVWVDGSVYSGSLALEDTSA